MEYLPSIERMADRIIREAIRVHATDIHFIPRKNDSLIQFRIANRLIPKMYISLEDCERLISHFKFSASMDIGEKRKPQNGALSFFNDGEEIGLRLSTLPMNQKESLVIRLLPKQGILPLHSLALFPHMTKKILTLMKQAYGLFIFCGPTGSGKTTTLYSLLEETKKTSDRNIITLEDPIEKEYDWMLQVQVNEKAGITYSTGLKAILRHDPDIIMVGEIRDRETAEIAVRAALTGHLVLTTMHTKDSKGAIYRLLEFGIDLIEMKETLLGVCAQRLVELTCPFCSKDCSPYCYSYNRLKRASVFELLTGDPLASALKGEEIMNYKTLKDMINKGIALGYIKESEYERWVVHIEKR